MSAPRKKKRKGRLESEVTASVELVLELRPDMFWWRNNNMVAKFDDRFVRGGGMPGSSDYMAIQAPHGTFWSIEVKREVGGEATEDQKRWAANMTAHGAKHVQVTSGAQLSDALGPPQVRVPRLKKNKVYPS